MILLVKIGVCVCVLQVVIGSIPSVRRTQAGEQARRSTHRFDRFRSRTKPSAQKQPRTHILLHTLACVSSSPRALRMAQCSGQAVPHDSKRSFLAHGKGSAEGNEEPGGRKGARK